MNGGVLHAAECLSPLDLSAAKSGYLYFGFEAVVALLNEILIEAKSDEELDRYQKELDKAYAALVPDDNALLNRFTKHHIAHGSEYSPLE